MTASARNNRLRFALPLLACLVLAGCGREALYSELQEQQANEVMAALLTAGIPAGKDFADNKKGWTVSVDEDDIPRAMEVLRSQNLPRDRHRSLGDIFQKEGFASSALEEKARFLYGLQEDISRTLNQIEGVVDARVHIALPERDPLGGDTSDSSASVMIFERPGANVRDRETDIKVFVKDSVEGLTDVNKVTVKFFTVSAPEGPPQAQANRQATLPARLSSINPLAFVLAAGVVALLTLAFTFVSRMRARARSQ